MKHFLLSFCLVFSFFLFSQNTCEPYSFSLFEFFDAKSGCCSWHDGVCGCSSGGRVVCCDGTLSPSCTCHH